jgi:predicted Ser/Thr protein kinase
MIDPNTVVGGRYRVLRLLGGGGMKLVYLAEDLRLAARPCALAEMVDTITSADMQRQAAAAFQREADMLAQLSNEHIPRIYDRFSDANRHYLVMEFVDGVTLEDLIRRSGGKLEERKILDVAVQILDTLEYLHHLSPPVIYRDLKPSNVMLTPSGQVKLVDFGIARFFRPQSNATMIGTQGYAPPEQYKGKVDFRSDLYALGATIHHALTGRDPALEPPFSFPPLRSLCPNASASLADVVDHALQYEVTNRVADAAEFKRRLLAVRDGNNAPSRVPSAGAAGAKPQLRLPLTAGQQAASASAPTILTNLAETECRHCHARVPEDSRFCSFCAADLWPGGGLSTGGHNAETFVLNAPAEHRFPARIEMGGRDARIPRRRGAGLYFAIFGAMFAAAFILATYVIQNRADDADYSAYRGPEAPARVPDLGVPSPDAPEPPHVTARERALRQALNRQGYRAVRFQITGDTISLWGRVPTEMDRLTVQAIVYTVGGVFWIDDHLQVEPGYVYR